MFATTHELARWYDALFAGKVPGPVALERVSWIDADSHLTIFSSVANHQAERVWNGFRDALVPSAREARQSRREKTPEH